MKTGRTGSVLQKQTAKWYSMDLAELLEYLETAGEGFDSRQVSERLEQYGPNSLEEEERVSKLKALKWCGFSRQVYRRFLLHSPCRGDSCA